MPQSNQRGISFSDVARAGTDWAMPQSNQRGIETKR